MRKAFLFLTLVVIGFAACKKGDNIYTSPNTPPYHIDGIKDLSFQKYNSGGGSNSRYLDLYITYENSEQEQVKLSVEGLPAGMSASFSDSVGYPSFSSRLYLIDTATVAGNYSARLVATGTTTGRKEFAININVLPAPTLNVLLVGNGYDSYSSCGGGSYSQNITAVSGTTDRIRFSSFDNSGNAVEATLTGNTTNGNLIIPTQTVNGTTYSGSGSSSYYYISNGVRHFDITYYRSTSGGGSNYCNVTLSL